MNRRLARAFSFSLILLAGAAQSAPQMDCSSLERLRLEATRVQSAEIVKGPFTPPGGKAPLADLPSFCRVTAVISPAIRFEVWLPLEGWNGKFQGTGNGGYNGVIVYNA